MVCGGGGIGGPCCGGPCPGCCGGGWWAAGMPGWWCGWWTGGPPFQPWGSSSAGGGSRGPAPPPPGNAVQARFTAAGARALPGPLLRAMGSGGGGHRRGRRDHAGGRGMGWKEGNELVNAPTRHKIIVLVIDQQCIYFTRKQESI